MIETSGIECLRTDLTSWEIGPYHGALPGAMRMRMRLDGEIIVSAEIETGFLHRGLEKAIELHPWPAAIAYADHLDPEGAVFGELALCLAIEEIASIEVPERAQAIRVLLSELTRISSLLGFVARMARSSGAETLLHYVLRDREKVLDLFELLTGARFSLNFLRLGGVRADVTEGFVERVIEACDLLWIRLREYNDLFTFNQVFLKRTSRIAVLSPEAIYRFGITGPNARASGVPFDVRKAHPYSGYERVDFDIPIGRGERGARGDAHDRFLLRLREISVSLEILRDVAGMMPPGKYTSIEKDSELNVPAGEGFARIESSRGMLGCHVLSDGGRFPARVQFKTPSTEHLLLIPELLSGTKVEDLPVVLASLDLNIAEADR